MCTEMVFHQYAPADVVSIWNSRQKPCHIPHTREPVDHAYANVCASHYCLETSLCILCEGTRSFARHHPSPAVCAPLTYGRVVQTQQVASDPTDPNQAYRLTSNYSNWTLHWTCPSCIPCSRDPVLDSNLHLEHPHPGQALIGCYL